MGRLNRAAATALLVFAASNQHLANAQQPPPRFCIVPALDGAPTAADHGDTWRISVAFFEIPHLPAPVFTPSNRRGQWTIDRNRRLVRYEGPFPKSFLDAGNWVEEPWSSRVVAVTYGGGVSVLEAGSSRFVKMYGATQSNGYNGGANYAGIQILPRRRLTIAITNGEMPLVVGGDRLHAWMTPDELKQHGLRGIRNLQDAPSLGATIVLDADGHIHVVTDDDKWSEIGSIDRDDHGQVIDIGNPGVVLYESGRSVLAIRKVDDNGSKYFAALTLATAAFNAGSAIKASPLFHQILAYDGTWPMHLWPRWRRLGPEGFADIEGGDVGIALAEIGAGGNYHDLPSLHRGVIQGRDSLFLYDGTRVTPVANGGSDRVDKFAHVYDLHSIGRVLVASKKGLFELTADGALVHRPMPFPTEGLAEPAITDWPEAGVALVSTKSGMFVLDGDLHAESVAGGEQVGFSGWWSVVRPIAAANATELVLTATPGLFLAVDSSRSLDNPCR